jgi:replicative DNA helicase
LQRGYDLCQLAAEKGKDFRTSVFQMIQTSKSFSPFVSPEKEHRGFLQTLDKDKGKDLLGISSGFENMDKAMGGIRGINIMGGPPKAGKSCFYMQISTEMARRKTAVIYYDFENGRQKIYHRTLIRLSRLSDVELRKNELDDKAIKRFKQAQIDFQTILQYFRVVTDRKLNPDIMRRHIDFLQHETRRDKTVVVIDSLHKLPFKDLSDRRTGIDSWFRVVQRHGRPIHQKTRSGIFQRVGGHRIQCRQCHDSHPELGSYRSDFNRRQRKYFMAGSKP